MTTHHLLHHFTQLTEAPAAVGRLRQLVLDLAVRGKLVAQEPTDEGSGVDLLNHIRRIKSELMIERKIHREKEIEYSEPEKEFEIPFNWTWAYIDDVAIVQGGKRLPEGATFSKVETPHIYIRVTDMKNGTIVADDLVYINPEIQRSIARYIINKEDLYITIAGTIGQVGRVPFMFDGHNLTENAAKIVFRGLNPEFLRLVLSSDLLQQQFRDKTKQMAQPKLALKRIGGAKFPLPPLAEQQRIVAKVDELMTLCDELAAAQSEREAHRDRLVAATLHRLTTAPADDPAPFPERARFYFNHLPRLTTRAEHIQGLRQTILNLAVQGKLVPQDPHDEPAGELLKRIQVEREKLAKEGKISKGQLSPPLNADEMPFQIPATWQWVRVAEVADSRLGKMLDKAKNKGALYRYLRNVNVRWFDFDLLDLAEMKFEDTELDEFSLRQGDVLICEGGEPGRSAVWDERDTDIYFQKAIHRVRFLGSIIPIYFVRALYQDACSGRLNQFFTGVGIKHFTGKELARYTFPLPPLAEQQRIVARVDELLALCDELAADLDTVTATRRRLLEAALAEALAAAA